MSTPSGIPGGSPDYARVQTVNGDPFLEINNGDQFLNGSLGPQVFVGPWPYLSVSLFSIAHGVELQLFFSLDEAENISGGTYLIDALAGDIGILVVPVLGAYLAIAGATSTGAPINDVVASICGYNASERPAVNLTSPALVTSTAQTVGATSTINLEGVWISPGKAHFSMDTTATSWAVTVQSVDFLGGTKVIWAMSTSLSVNPHVDMELVLPATHIRVVITNNDAAAKIFRVRLQTEF